MTKTRALMVGALPLAVSVCLGSCTPTPAGAWPVAWVPLIDGPLHLELPCAATMKEFDVSKQSVPEWHEPAVRNVMWGCEHPTQVAVVRFDFGARR